MGRQIVAADDRIKIRGQPVVFEEHVRRFPIASGPDGERDVPVAEFFEHPVHPCKRENQVMIFVVKFFHPRQGLRRIPRIIEQTRHESLRRAAQSGEDFHGRTERPKGLDRVGNRLEHERQAVYQRTV